MTDEGGVEWIELAIAYSAATFLNSLVPQQKVNEGTELTCGTFQVLWVWNSRNLGDEERKD